MLDGRGGCAREGVGRLRKDERMDYGRFVSSTLLFTRLKCDGFEMIIMVSCVPCSGREEEGKGTLGREPEKQLENVDTGERRAVMGDMDGWVRGIGEEGVMGMYGVPRRSWW